MQNKLSCYNEAIRRLSYRLYSTKELKNFLFKKGYNEIDILDVINNLLEKSILDDKKFVSLYILGRGLRRNLSINRIYLELRDLVEVDNLKEIIKEMYLDLTNGENEIIKKIITKKLKNKDINSLRPEEEAKLINYISAKGFNIELIKNIIKSLKSK